MKLTYLIIFLYLFSCFETYSFERIPLSDSSFIEITKLKEETFLPVQGLFNHYPISSGEAEEIVQKMKNTFELSDAELDPATGYFSANWKIPHSNPEEIKDNFPTYMGKLKKAAEQFNLKLNFKISKVSVKAPEIEGVDLKKLKSLKLIDRSAFSGQKQLNIVEFLKEANQDIGDANLMVNGSEVKVGIVDTGITYNHPIFRGKDKKSRIKYMNEFTNEGRILFDINAPVIIENINNKLLLTGSYISFGDIHQMIKAPLLVSDTISTELKNSKNKIYLGIFHESDYNTDEQLFDFDQNGKTNDDFFTLLIEKEDKSLVLIFNPKMQSKTSTGELNFTEGSLLGDWNKTHQMMRLKAEMAGFIFKSVSIGGNKYYSANMVGIDPGNHGTHVAGILAGGKLFQNDRDDTLAKGVASEAEINLNRVCSNHSGCNSSEALIDIVKIRPDVINMSLGGLNAENDGYDLESQLVDRISDIYGIQFFISAGNSGPSIQTVGAPSVAEEAISVAAAATPEMIQKQTLFPLLNSNKESDGSSSDVKNEMSQDFILYFSSRGPNGAGGFKPMLSAPGTQLSSISQNSLPNDNAPHGLDRYWGTSMASPMAAGAYTVLLDAARKFNLAHPDTPLPTDRRTLKQVLLGSAREFNKKVDPEAGKYTWIDEGLGMIDLLKAWRLLKDSRIIMQKPNFVVTNNDWEGLKKDLPVFLDYKVRTVTGPNRYQIPYNGELVSEGLYRYGQGIWIEPMNLSIQSYKIYIERQIPSEYVLSEEFEGILKQMRDTTFDEFDLEVESYGSQLSWAKLTEFSSVNCQILPEKKDLEVSSTGFNQWSSIDLCLNPTLIRALPPGDYGLIIKGFRKVDGVRSPFPSFVVPVHMNLPNLVLKNATSEHSNLKIQDQIKNFEVQRHYVEVPTGTTMMRIVLKVPEAITADDGLIKNCSAVKFFISEASNSVHPNELDSFSYVRNCLNTGESSSNQQKIEIQRERPKSGIWDFHVLGNFSFPLSSYEIDIDYSRVKSDKNEITGSLNDLKGSLLVDVEESTFETKPSVQKSTYILQGLIYNHDLEIHQGEKLLSLKALNYNESVVSVELRTYVENEGQTDIDLFLYECSEKVFNTDPKVCQMKAKSTESHSHEKINFTPNKSKFYFAMVEGYHIDGDTMPFQLKEKVVMKNQDYGSITTEEREKKTLVNYTLTPQVLNEHEDFKNRKANLFGELSLRNDAGMFIMTLPVLIKAN